MRFTFTAPLWRWPSRPAWHFVTVPFDIADEIEDLVTTRGGFDSVKVTASTGSFTWSTSLFPSAEHHSFVLPVKKAARDAANAAEGDQLTLSLTINHTPRHH